MKIAMSGIMFDKRPLPEAIEAAARIGYDCIELRGTAAHLPPDATAAQVASIKRQVADAGIAVSSIASFTGYYGSIDDQACAEELEKFKRYVGIAAELGAGNVRHWIGKGASAQADAAQWQKAIHWLQKAADFAADYPVKVALELHHQTFLDTTDAALKVYDLAGRDNIGFIHDGVNFYFDHEPLGGACIKRLGHRLINVHFKDIVQLPEAVNPRVTVYQDQYFVYRTINTGAVDQYAIVKALLEIGYDACLTVESSNLLTPFDLAKNEYEQLRLILADLQAGATRKQV
jgi:3-dehydroshikimate dehydratase